VPSIGDPASASASSLAFTNETSAFIGIRASSKLLRIFSATALPVATCACGVVVLPIIARSQHCRTDRPDNVAAVQLANPVVGFDAMQPSWTRQESCLSGRAGRCSRICLRCTSSRPKYSAASIHPPIQAALGADISSRLIIKVSQCRCPDRPGLLFALLHLWRNWRLPRGKIFIDISLQFD
jgi:hypothetical protein